MTRNLTVVPVADYEPPIGAPRRPTVGRPVRSLAVVPALTDQPVAHAAAAFADVALRGVLEVVDGRRPFAQLQPLLGNRLADTVITMARSLRGRRCRRRRSCAGYGCASWTETATRRGVRDVLPRRQGAGDRGTGPASRGPRPTPLAVGRAADGLAWRAWKAIRSVSNGSSMPRASEIFALVADAGKHASFDGSGTVQHAAQESMPLSKGSKFGMSMKMGLPYRTTNTVIEYEPDRRIAWQTTMLGGLVGGRIWRYELEPTEASRRGGDIQSPHPRARNVGHLAGQAGTDPEEHRHAQAGRAGHARDAGTYREAGRKGLSP